MPTTIKLRNSVTTTSAPSSLVQGEVAINITDKKVWVGNAATTPIQLLGDGGSASFTSIAFGAGTVSSPSITFIGDTNTGIYSPAADTIAFTEGGVESMRIDSSGNVGIGTSSPATKLDVNGSVTVGSTGASDYALIVKSTSATGIVGSQSAFSAWGGGLQPFPAINIGSTTNHPVVFGTNNLGRVVIDSSGNVGIGTSSPTNYGAGTTTLSISNSSGSGYFDLYNAGSRRGYHYATASTYNISTTTSTALVFETVGSERMRIDSSGNVVIGTTASLSSYKTTIQHTSGELLGLNASSGTLTRIAFGNADTSFGATQIIANSTSLALITGSAERMRITSGGDVGIGTTSPSSLFHVAGGNIRCDGTTGSGFKTVISVNSGADRDIFLAGVAGITNGFTVQYVNSGTALSVKFASITTTASAANAFLDSGDANRLYRSTSSLRYKKDIENIEQSNSDAVLNLRPVWYRSKADNDKKEWSWYGLIAEEVAEIEPRLVHWTYLDSDYDSVVEENGNIKKTLKEGAKLVPDGVQYERVAVLLLDVVKRQEQAIQEQQAMIEELKQEVAKLKGV